MVVPTTVDCACKPAMEQIPIMSVKIFFIVLFIYKTGRKIIKKIEEIIFRYWDTITNTAISMKIFALLFAVFICAHTHSQQPDSLQ